VRIRRNARIELRERLLPLLAGDRRVDFGRAVGDGGRSLRMGCRGCESVSATPMMAVATRVAALGARPR
jgi:hypothetical protein